MPVVHSKKKYAFNKITTMEMELLVSRHFNYRTNLIVPNVSWGLFNHECDLIVVTPSGICSEIEIKISRSDLLADKKKTHAHGHENKIHKLWFAIPEYLENCIEDIPRMAGVLMIGQDYGIKNIKVIRPPKLQYANKWNEKQFLELYRLASMRTWTLKEKLFHLQESNRLNKINKNIT